MVVLSVGRRIFSGRRCRSLLLRSTLRTIAIRPVRTSSTMPNGRIRSMKASIFFSWPAISTITSSGATSTMRPRKIVARLANLGCAGRRLHLDLDQHQVAFDVVARADVVDADDGDDLFELLADLLEHAVVADDDERHPRETWDLRFRRRRGYRCCSRARRTCRPHGPARRGRFERWRRGRDASSKRLQKLGKPR